MLGIYLYCIRPKGSPQFFSSGLDEQHRIEFLPFRDIEAVVSRVSLEKFGSKEARKKAKEDVQWIKEKGLAHADIVKKALAGTDGRLIPMKFGAIFKTRKALEAILNQHYRDFVKSFAKLGGTQEWGIKVYLRKELLKERLRREDPEVKRKAKDLAIFPQGAAYLLKNEIEEYIEAKLQGVLKKYPPIFLQKFAVFAEDLKENEPLDKEFSGEKEPMILNLVLLLSKENVKNFTETTKALKKEFGSQGFIFRYSGPWPPYNFV